MKQPNKTPVTRMLAINWDFKLLFILCCLFSCQQGSQPVQPQTLSVRQAGPKGALNIVLQPPKKVYITQPLSISLENCPKPQTITIPTKSGNYTIQTKSDAQKINLEPPSTIFLPVLKNRKGEPIKPRPAIRHWLDGHIDSTWAGVKSEILKQVQHDREPLIATETISSFILGEGGISNFTSYNSDNGLYSSIPSILEDKAGNLWFGTDGGGVSRYDGKSFTSYTTAQGLANNTVLSSIEDKAGNLWFGTSGGGVSRYDGRSFISYTTAQGLANNDVRSIIEDKAGNLWFGTHGGGVSRYDGKSFISYTTAQGLANNDIRSIIEDKAGNLWFGTAGGGISCYDGHPRDGNTPCFTCYTTAQGLANNDIRSIIVDKAGNLWFGTYGGGVSRYEGKSFISFTITQGLPNTNIFSIIEDKAGNLWFGTDGGGVSRYDGKSFTNYTTAQGLGNNNVWSIIEDKAGNLWFGTAGGGVSRYDGKSFTSYTTAQGLGNNDVRNIIEDKAGNLWFGTSGGGVSRYDGKSFISYTAAQGLVNNKVLSIIEDKAGNLWFGTDGGGVSRYDGKSFTNYTTAQGLANNTILSILEDKGGNLWFGTAGGGVSRYDGKSFISYSTAQGLADDNVFARVQDKTGIIWMGTNLGFSGLTFETKSSPSKSPGGREESRKFIPAGIIDASNEVLNTCTPVFEIYNYKRGYPVYDVNGGSNNGAMLCDSRGIIWAGTGNDKHALVRFDPSVVNKDTMPPIIIIQSVKVNEENICWYSLQSSIGGRQLPGKAALFPKSPKSHGADQDSALVTQQEMMTSGKVKTEQERDTILKRYGDIQFEGITKFYPIPEHLVLPYEHNSITFSFVAIETNRNFLVRYQYMLEGYNKDWSPLTDKTEATFGNIYEGDYTFKLKAQSPEGIWSEPVTYTFKVLPPLYRTWWAYSIYAILLIAAISIIVWWNGRRLRAKAKELTQKVNEATTEIREQKKVVEDKNKDILDSITYAKRLQDAILPPLNLIKYYLPESFVLYKPKDIVAGDFYWMGKTGDTLFIAAADCTGHGVPGAIVSVVCSNALNRAIKEFHITETGKILDKVRELVLETFEKSESDVKDGMDISLCAINTVTKQIQWSGANNPLWYLKGNELKEIKADKQPIGKQDNPEPFMSHSLQLRQGDIIYLFSDGFADQFGGPKGKKFKHKQLQEIIIAMAFESMAHQNEKLNTMFENWKGSLEQVDDVLIIGIRI